MRYFRPESSQKKGRSDVGRQGRQGHPANYDALQDKAIDSLVDLFDDHSGSDNNNSEVESINDVDDLNEAFSDEDPLEKLVAENILGQDADGVGPVGEHVGETADDTTAAAPPCIERGLAPADPEVLPEDPDPAVPRPRHVPAKAAKEFSTPPEVQGLAPPQCTFVLDKKAHRFSFRFRRLPEPNVWNHYRYPLNMSRAFSKESRESWKRSLEEIHGAAWERWALAKEQTAFKIDEALQQTPRHIPGNILEAIQGHISSLPPRVNYGSK